MNDSTNASIEAVRLDALREYALLGTPPEPQFDDLARLASYVCETPVALISLIDADRQWFKAKVGTDLTETPREIAFCNHTIRDPHALLVVPDLRLDPRFAGNPLVTGEHRVQFYAGMALTTSAGQAIGTLCVIDFEPRELDANQADSLKALARQVVSQMELRRNAAENARLCADARQTARRAHHAATHDDLTGLPNRALFAKTVEDRLVRAAKDADHAFAVLVIDLDRFKLVNDGYGHAVGDLLISTIACRIGETLADLPELQERFTVGRFGGDAFMVLLDDVGDPAAAAAVAEQVLTSIARPFYFGPNVVHPGASAGLVVGSASYVRADDLIRDADAALYQAKAVGRSKCVAFDLRMHEQAVQRLRLESELRRAVEYGELTVHYQPVVDLNDRQTIGFEALVRWNKNGKLISPADFIPVAEETGLIVPIGRWVLGEAVRQMAQWQAMFPERQLTKMAVNLSRRQLHDPQLIPLVNELLDVHNLEPHKLMLEITESVVMDDADNAHEALDRLHDLGVKLAMDDFGTGYSSLSCLHDFPLDVLKVDRSFVANLNHRREAAVLRAVLQLARNLGLMVVAEGIETIEQMAFLRAAACDFGQGYLFSKPMTAEAATTYLGDGGLAQSA